LSGVKFLTEGGKIRFSLAAVKNVGAGVVLDLIADRTKNGEYASYGAFLRRMSATGMNRKAVESLVKAGACDSFGIERARMVAVIDICFAQETTLRKTQIEGQMTLFESCDTQEARDLADMEPSYPDIRDFGPEMRLAMEKEMLGFYLSGHPLDRFADVIRRYATIDSSALSVHPAEENEDVQPEEAFAASRPGLNEGAREVMAGLVLARKNKTTRKNDLMCFLTLEDLSGEYEAIVFPRVLREYSAILQPDAAVLLEGTVGVRAASGGREESEGQLTVDRVRLLDEMEATIASSLRNGKPAGRHVSAPDPEPPPEEDGVLGYPEPPPEEDGLPPVPDSTSRDARAKGHSEPALCVRYFGRRDDPGYRRLLSMLRFFHGDCRTEVYLDQTGERILMPEDCWVERTDPVLRLIAGRMGIDNIAFV